MLVDGRPPQIFSLYAFAVALVIGWLLVPLTERFARRIGAIDVPKERSLHSVPTPRLGGLAMLAGAVVAGLLFLPFVEQNRAILGGALAIAVIGLVDDVRELPAGVKLAGQFVAAAIPVFNGVSVGDFTFPFAGSVNLHGILIHHAPWLGNIRTGQLLTLLGLVAMMNVINLIDGVDGLAAGVCVISAATLAIIALSLDRTGAGVLAALTAGAALGFLRHGFPPASSFMGDTGSNLLGYLLGITAIEGALKTNAVVALFLPLLVLAVPILDTGFVVAKRIKYKRPIYAADRWHFHHRMANIGFSQRRTLAYLYGWAGIMAGLALALRYVPYSDDHGHFHAGWTVVMLACFAAALAASVYLVIVLEILKLRGVRSRQLFGALGKRPSEAEVDAGVAAELETGTFETVNPDTGTFEVVDPETGEFTRPPG
jgi:UDP-GlcNAc:undecaprenyl-phosphate/decaprenyl-phosphate GlcNAc-1-phosphate transferase